MECCVCVCVDCLPQASEPFGGGSVLEPVPARNPARAKLPTVTSGAGSAAAGGEDAAAWGTPIDLLGPGAAASAAGAAAAAAAMAATDNIRASFGELDWRSFGGMGTVT